MSDEDWARLRETVGAARAVELLEVFGLRIGLRELGAARRDGRIAAVRIGDVWRYDPEALEAFAESARNSTSAGDGETRPGALDDERARVCPSNAIAGPAGTFPPRARP